MDSFWQEGPNQAARRRHVEEEERLLESNTEVKEVKKWDLFQDPPRKTESGSMADVEFFNKTEKFMKLIAYIVTFIIVLGSAVISKGTLLFMTSQVFNQTKSYCNKDLGSNKQLVVNTPETERVVWIWMLFYAFCMPQFGTFIRSMRICFFKSWDYPKIGEVLLTLFTETLPSIGSAIMIFCILPELDVVKGAMLTNAICFIPALMAFITRDPNCSISSLKLILDVVSIAAQVTSFVVWPMVGDDPKLWLIPVSVIFISFGWWENYVSDETPITVLKSFANEMKKIRNTRYFIYAFVSLWKCVVFFITMLIIFQLREGDVQFLFDSYKKAMTGDYKIIIDEIKPVIRLDDYPNIADLIQENAGTDISPNQMTPIWVFLINIGSTYLCYVFGKFACKVMIQGFSFAFPLCLATPVVVTGLIAMSSAYLQDECVFSDTIPMYLFFDIPPFYMLQDFIAHQQSWIWLIWLLSQVWITIHIWTPNCVRQAPTEKLFVRPMYDPFFIDQDVSLNRRRDESKYTIKDEINEDVDGNTMVEEDTNYIYYYNNDDEEDEENDDTVNDDTTRIFACGTMWRETAEEMLEFLKSIMRLDEDQAARRLLRHTLGISNRDDYYTLETHVFFDDAFDGPHINKYVKQLIKNIDSAASNVHEEDMKLRAPYKYETPYGGRLVWLLPGKTKLLVHLKDKKKIRAKKRWSQVMYMYYLLGHRLMDRDNVSNARKEKIAANTFILALDGDIDFQPKALTLLVDLMKKNEAVGAACGRIHPIGSGPMVWYQMFEYAVGHWLQKATEHMIGCVLCSPGCFSLFRGKALMDKNVMKKYTTVPTQARHYVQYDQGEDRWLCTLLLQRGYRVEYSAASDAYTHCPENFDEFYKQRRRWMPSTTANILDLLMDYKHTISVNDNISRLYIAYQLLLMCGTILGPGTIFLMLVGAFVAAFQMDQWTSFLWNIVPILIFIIVCRLFSKDEIQLFFAGVISGIYGLVMMAVLVGIMLQIKNDGLLAPSSLFFFIVAGEMIVTALLHPKEINCLVYGVVYYVTVPSMYMLLVIYTVFNMNNISWGTRDSGIEKEKANAEKEKIMEDIKKEPNMQQKMMSFFNMNKDDGGSFEISLSGLFRCMFCTREKQPVEKYQLDEISRKLDDLYKGIHGIEQPIPEQEPAENKTKLYEGTDPIEKDLTIDAKDKQDTVSIEENPLSWMDDELLRKSEKKNIKNKQRDFWNLLLEKYLHPLEVTKEEEKAGKEELNALRDKVVAAFFMLNSLFVLIIFLLTLKKDFLHIKWPFDVKTNFTYHADINQITMSKEYLQLEPIGMVFLLFFAILLVIQFLGMLFHRFKTLCQILSTTTIDISLTKPKANELSKEDLLKMNAVEFVRDLKKLNDKGLAKKRRDPVAARKTVLNLFEDQKNKEENPPVIDLEEDIKRRITHYYNNQGAGGNLRRETKAVLNQITPERRKTIIEQPPRGPRGIINEGFQSDI